GPQCAPGVARDQRFFFWRQEQVAGRQREEVCEDSQLDRRVFFCRWNQDGAVGDNRKAKERRVVAKRPEQDAVVLAAVRTQMIDQRGRVRTVLAKPALLALGRRSRVKHFVAEIGEGL